MRQTSLEGTEVDNLIRNINPKLYVKIVDACHSGLKYIKSKEDFDEYARKFSTSFQQLYFMFSSLSDQYSYSGKDLSRFTRSIVKSVSDTSKERVRYKDVIDAVSDNMATTGQTPYFVTQAQFTEIFCEVDDELKSELSQFLIDVESVSIVVDKGEADELLAIIEADAQRYATHEEAKTALHLLFESFNSSKLAENLDKYYSLETSVMKGSSSQFSGIGKWLEENESSDQFFCKAKIREQNQNKKNSDQQFCPEHHEW